MAQERIDNRYTPMQNGNGLMYNTGAMEGEMPQGDMQWGDNMSNMPAGGGMNASNTQRGDGLNPRALGFTAPPPINFDTEEMRGSIQYILSKNVGEYVVIEFLIGTSMIMRKQGILYYVGTSYVTLYDNRENNFIVCDIFSVKFVYFYFPGDRPAFNFNVLREEYGSMQMGRINSNNNTPANVNESMRRQQNMRR